MMNSKRPLYQPPVPSTEFEGDAELCGNVLGFRYFRGGALRRSGIRFGKISATRMRSEKCCNDWHIEGAYDTLVEIIESEWLAEILADTQEIWRTKWKNNHYMIYLDSAGCFEFIAESWQILPEITGTRLYE